MSYLFLLAAILSEVAGTSLLKASAGFTKIVPAVLAFVFYLVTLASMTMAYKTLSIGFVYAVWSGLGIFLVTLVGLIIFKEPVIWQKFIFIGFIVVGVVGLNLLKDGV